MHIVFCRALNHLSLTKCDGAVSSRAALSVDAQSHHCQEKELAAIVILGLKYLCTGEEMAGEWSQSIDLIFPTVNLKTSVRDKDRLLPSIQQHERISRTLALFWCDFKTPMNLSHLYHSFQCGCCMNLHILLVNPDPGGEFAAPAFNEVVSQYFCRLVAEAFGGQHQSKYFSTLFNVETNLFLN